MDKEAISALVRRRAEACERRGVGVKVARTAGVAVISTADGLRTLQGDEGYFFVVKAEAVWVQCTEDVTIGEVFLAEALAYLEIPEDATA